MIGFVCVCERARRKTARCSISDVMDKRKVYDAIDELTTVAKFVMVYRVAWSRLRKRWIKISKSLSIKPHKRNFILLCISQSQFWNQFNNTNKKYYSFKTVVLKLFGGIIYRTVFLVESFSFVNYNRSEISNKYKTVWYSSYNTFLDH